MHRQVKLLLIIIFVFPSFSPSYTQKTNDREFARAIQHADISFYYDEDYEKAASEYEALFIGHPDNHNLAAKLGICYLNMDGKTSEALRLLKMASQNIVENEKDYIEYGEKAPLDTYIYLAVAYHKSDSLEKALSMFYDVKKRLSSTDIFREDYIDNQIRDCRYAIEMKKKPLTILKDLFVPWLNDYNGACNPVLAANDSVFIFTVKNADKTRILCSYKEGKEWSEPSDITRQLGGYDRFYSNSITADGKTLVLFMDDGGDGNLFLSYRSGNTWSRIKSPGKNINSIYWESHGCISPDGRFMFFSSNRQGGEGDLDIWKSERLPDGSWQKPVNCGNIINTPFNEDTPFFDEKNNALIFSSAGHISMGGYDIFRSINKNGAWSQPVGMPFAFNTSADNTFFIVPNNSPGFIASLYDQESESRNIYHLVAIDPSDEITIADGAIKTSDDTEIDIALAGVTLFDMKKRIAPTQVMVGEGGKYKMQIKPGSYQVQVKYPGYKTDTINIELPLYHLSRYMALESTLVPEKVSGGKFLSVRNILFNFDSFELTGEAISTLEELKIILIENPGLKIEVAGFTDALGSVSYNRQLGAKRSQAAIDYLVKSGIQESQLIRKTFGESVFVAINKNPDGTDNPEGRSLNRRVEFGLVDPQTGVVLKEDSYIPDRLRTKSSIKYIVVLKKSSARINPDQFNNLNLNGIQFVRTIETDSLFYSAAGYFHNRPDAISFLSHARSLGFSEAYIANNYDLNSEISVTSRLLPVTTNKRDKIYTIQLSAARSPVNLRIFREIPDIKEIYCEDGFFRYLTGEFDNLANARDERKRMIEAGFKDAFIRELSTVFKDYKP